MSGFYDSQGVSSFSRPGARVLDLAHTIALETLERDSVSALDDSALAYSDILGRLKENIHLFGDAEKTILLTAGYDSRALLAAVLDERRQFTFVTFFDQQRVDSNHDDVRVARQLARRYELNHRVIELSSGKVGFLGESTNAIAVVGLGGELVRGGYDRKKSFQKTLGASQNAYLEYVGSYLPNVVMPSLYVWERCCLFPVLPFCDQTITQASKGKSNQHLRELIADVDDALIRFPFVD